MGCRLDAVWELARRRPGCTLGHGAPPLTTASLLPAARGVCRDAIAVAAAAAAAAVGVGISADAISVGGAPSVRVVDYHPVLQQEAVLERKAFLERKALLPVRGAVGGFAGDVVDARVHEEGLSLASLESAFPARGQGRRGAGGGVYSLYLFYMCPISRGPDRDNNDT